MRLLTTGTNNSGGMWGMEPMPVIKPTMRAAGNLRPQLLPLSRTRPPAERNCPTNASRALLLNSFQLIPTGASFTCSSVACFPHLSPKGGSINEKQWRQSSGHKKPHGHFRKPMAGGSRLPSVGARLGGALAIGTRSPFDARPIDRAEKCPAAAGAPGEGSPDGMVGRTQQQ
jgi:hypothetical protein